MNSTNGASIRQVLQPQQFDLIHQNYQTQQKPNSRGRNMSTDLRRSPAKPFYASQSLQKSNLPIQVQPPVPPQTPPRGGVPWKMRQISKSIHKSRDVQQPKQFYQSNYNDNFMDHSTNKKVRNPYQSTTHGFYNTRTVQKQPYRVDTTNYQSEKRVPTEQSVPHLKNEQINLQKNLIRPRAQTAHSKDKKIIQEGVAAAVQNNQNQQKREEPKVHLFNQPSHYVGANRENKNSNQIRGKSTQLNQHINFDDQKSQVSNLSKYTSQSRLITNESATVENSNCFDIDYSFLDQISMNDPNIQKILNDDILSNKSLALDQMLDENPDYFHHLFGNCACFQCTCTECKCNFAYIKLTYKPGFTTHNQKEYRYKPAGTAEIPGLNQTNYESLADLSRTQTNIDPMHTTTHNHFYKTPDLQPRFKRPQFYRAEHPFMGTTSYTNQFKDWKDYDPNWIFKRPQNVDVVGSDFPIAGNTSYGQFFNKNQDPIANATAQDVKFLQKHTVIGDVYRDDKPTMYNSKYQDFKIQDVPNTYLPFKWFSETQQPNLIPSFDNQFQTTFANQFGVQSQNQCPSQKAGMTQPWKAKLLNKLRAFRDAQIAAKLQGKTK